jgi:hypothetical protein
MHRSDKACSLMFFPMPVLPAILESLWSATLNGKTDHRIISQVESLLDQERAKLEALKPNNKKDPSHFNFALVKTYKVYSIRRSMCPTLYDLLELIPVVGKTSTWSVPL